MRNFRFALANIRAAKSADESIAIALDAIAEAAGQNAELVCFPECSVPGYRIGASAEAPDQEFLNRAWAAVDRVAGDLGIAVLLGTERIEGAGVLITARFTDKDGRLQGFQDKVQLDPSEEPAYQPGVGRRLFQCGAVTLGVVICREGWRYPETVRWAVRAGAQIVFHPHTEIVDDPQFRPAGFADPKNSFHEKAALCRAAENNCFFATVNHALPGASTTSAVVRPDGTLLAYHPCGQHGLLIAEIDPAEATGYLAQRLRTS